MIASKEVVSFRAPDDLLFFSNDYLGVHRHSAFRHFENDYSIFQCVLEGEVANSLPKSLFGSFYKKKSCDEEACNAFISNVIKQLKEDGSIELFVKHPSPIYKNFYSPDLLDAHGFKILFKEINQHIELSNQWEQSIHKMQKRKLNSLEKGGFAFEIIPMRQLSMVHKFISACRQVHGLEINITLDDLEELARRTGKYDLFGVTREGKLSAACVSVRVNNEVAYYYLPATSPTFKNYSPMVMLVKGMVAYYHQKNFKYLDLGISSQEGRPQESLRTFKNRMGAKETYKPVYVKSLNGW